MRKDNKIVIGVLIFSVICGVLGYFDAGGLADKYPKTYYHGENGERVYYIINRDGTAKVKTSMGGTNFNFDTSWSNIGGRIWIKTQMGYSNVIWEGYVYKDIDDANAKRNGIKVTLQE